MLNFPKNRRVIISMKNSEFPQIVDKWLTGRMGSNNCAPRIPDENSSYNVIRTCKSHNGNRLSKNGNFEEEGERMPHSLYFGIAKWMQYRRFPSIFELQDEIQYRNIGEKL